MGHYIYRTRQNIFQFRGCNVKNCSKIFFWRSKHHVCLKLRNKSFSNSGWTVLAQHCRTIKYFKFFSPYRKTANAKHTFILSCIMCSYFWVSFQTLLLHTNCSLPSPFAPFPITFQDTIIYVTKLFLNLFLCSSHSQTSFMEAFDGMGQLQTRSSLTRPVL